MSVSLSASRLSRSEPFAIAHVKLMKDDDTTIEDSVHELYVYKVSYSINVVVTLRRCMNKLLCNVTQFSRKVYHWVCLGLQL